MGVRIFLDKGIPVRVRAGYGRMYLNSERSLPRTDDMHLEHIRLALALKKPVKGVKGPSVTSLLDNLSIINSFPPDYLHSCLEGVSKLFITACFCSSNKNEIWYLGNKTTQFDEKSIIYSPAM